MNSKTKKIVIMIISIVSLLSLVPSLINAIFHLTGLQEYPVVEMEGMQTLSVNAQIVCVFLTTILTIFVLIFSRDVIKHKVILILLSMVQFLVGNPILAGAVIIILCFKTKDACETVILPTMEKQSKRHRILYLILFLITFVINYSPLFTYLMKTVENELYLTIITLGIMMLSMICIVYPVIVLGKEILSDLKVFKKNFKTYMAYIVPKMGIFIIIYFIVAIVLQFVVKDFPTNQNVLNEMPLWQSAALALLYAPIVEETFFRGFLRRGIRNKKIFVIVSALLFGLIHMMAIEENILVYLYSIVYIMLGYFFARTYAKTENIVSNMMLHFLWNLISVISMILMVL